jgi:hypothetical protein
MPQDKVSNRLKQDCHAEWQGSNQLSTFQDHDGRRSESPRTGHRRDKHERGTLADLQEMGKSQMGNLTLEGGCPSLISTSGYDSMGKNVYLLWFVSEANDEGENEL